MSAKGNDNSVVGSPPLPHIEPFAPARLGALPLHDIVTYRGTVYPWHCDHMGHMNVMWYMGKFDEAVWNLFLEVGLTPSYLRCKR
jgi:hypothetical protein